MASIGRAPACPFCRSVKAASFSRDSYRDYYQCPVCGLVFVPPAQFLSLSDEKKRYDLHRNSLDDAGYRAFLNRLFLPLQERLSPGSSGLDFGSGPEPALARMFTEAGHSVTLFDQFYAPAPAALERRYDFIIACEVVEHLREPAVELDRLWGCLDEGGWLGIMTKPAAEREAFSSWYYKNDRTHICFFSSQTFSWLARQWNAEVAFVEKDVILFRHG